MGIGDIKEMQMTEGDWEEKEFGSSDGAWLNRKGPFCFSTPSLHSFFVNFHHVIALCLFSTRCHRSICLNVCFQSSGAALLLSRYWHMNTWVFTECMDVKTSRQDDLQRECVCAEKGPWSVFKVSVHWDWSCSLRNDEHLRQTQVADLMDVV